GAGPRAVGATPSDDQVRSRTPLFALQADCAATPAHPPRTTDAAAQPCGQRQGGRLPTHPLALTLASQIHALSSCFPYGAPSRGWVRALSGIFAGLVLGLARPWGGLSPGPYFRYTKIDGAAQYW